jgi:HAD superfamily hydrolase (TIGR01490 family)
MDLAVLALFDFDGTITRAETFQIFLRAAARPLRVALGGLALSPLIVGYKLELVPAGRVRAPLVRLVFRGEPADRIRERGEHFAREVLPGLVRPQARERIAWHTQQGHTVAVVSASLDAYLVPWCRDLGLDLICSELEERDGKLTGEYVGGDCYGAEKSRRIRARYPLEKFDRIYAYGDTHEDLEMLEMAHEAYFRWEPMPKERRSGAC